MTISSPTWTGNTPTCVFLSVSCAPAWHVNEISKPHSAEARQNCPSDF
jgi:hypothetical protein